MRTSPILATLLACGMISGADTYYVSPSGQDAHDGRTARSAWKTLAKVGATAFRPGDRILFERGGEWREALALAPGCRGAPDAPITFDAYGDGPKPRFLGSEPLANAGFAPAGNDCYAYRIAGLPDGQIYVLRDHAFLGDGPAEYRDGALTIGSPSDPRRDGRRYAVCVRGNLIASNGGEHLVFRNLVADESAGQLADGGNQGYGIRIQGGTDVLVEDCESYRAGRHNVGAINTTGFVARRVACAYAAPRIAGANTLFVSYADHGAPVARCEHRWIDCTAEHGEAGDGGFYDAFTTHGENQGRIDFVNFRAAGGKVSLMAAPVSFAGGRLSGGSRLENFGAGLVVDGTVFTDRAFIDQWGDRGTFQNLLFDHGTPGEAGAIIIRPGKAGNVIRFCTIATAGHECISFYGAAPGTRVYASILMGAALGGGDPADLAYADSNLYGGGPALARDAHARSGDPLFVDAAHGDYALRPGSPCIDAAASVPAADRPAADRTGAPRSSGAGPDIGALESGAGPAAR